MFVNSIYAIPTPILHDASKEKHLHVHDVTGHSECCLFKSNNKLLWNEIKKTNINDLEILPKPMRNMISMTTMSTRLTPCEPIAEFC